MDFTLDSFNKILKTLWETFFDEVNLTRTVDSMLLDYHNTLKDFIKGIFIGIVKSSLK